MRRLPGVVGDLVGAAGTAAGGALGKPSDRRLKKNIESLSGVLDKLARIQPVAFDYIHTGRHQIGVIAQEIEPHFPQAVSKGSLGEEHMMTVDYGQLVAVALQSSKELHAMVEKLSKRVEELEAAQVTSRAVA